MVFNSHIVACLNNIQARVALLRELQSATGEELDALLPSVPVRAAVYKIKRRSGRKKEVKLSRYPKRRIL